MTEREAKYRDSPEYRIDQARHYLKKAVEGMYDDYDVYGRGCPDDGDFRLRYTYTGKGALADVRNNLRKLEKLEKYKEKYQELGNLQVLVRKMGMAREKGKAKEEAMTNEQVYEQMKKFNII